VVIDAGGRRGAGVFDGFGDGEILQEIVSFISKSKI
jgi:hypothetical protein